MEGDYPAEHLFTLRQSLKLYRYVLVQIAWDSRVDPTDQPPPPASKLIKVEGLTAKESQDLRQHGYRLLGVDLTQVGGLNGGFIQVFLTEVEE